MFQPVSSKVSFPQMEEAILRLWRERDIFPKSVQQRPEDRLFIFYEGPPYANASPGVHHVLSRIYKDVMVRYKTMRGYRVPRKAGWDTHGLPAELEVERALGFKSKADIEAFGIEEFNRRCRENVFAYLKEWEALTERIAFWLDLKDAYVTCHNDYIETCWWVVKQLWDRGLVYQDYRVTPHCPRCGTSLSDHEVAQGYKEDTPDPSVYIKFRLTPESQAKLAQHVPGDEPTYFLAWTTTPWTLPGNTALAVDPEAEYAVVAVGGERLILASALVGASLDDETGVLGRVPGRELAGLHYEPLFEALSWGIDALWFDHEGRLTPLQRGQTVEKAYAVIAADFVSLSEGTGIVHMAPAFGAEDFDAGKAEGLLFVQPVDLRGNMTAPGTSFDGLFVKDADGPILDDLKARGLLLRRETIHHTYPFCWRCDTPLLYYAKPTWYIRTTAVKDRLVALNQEINWYPAHIRDGRFGNWLENNIDWAASRERFWGIPHPHLALREVRRDPLHRLAGRAAGGGAGQGQGGGPGRPPSPLRRRYRPRPAPAAAACAACRRCWTSGSTRAPCPTPSGTIPSRTRRRSAGASPPTSSPRPWTRRAAGSTPSTPCPPSCFANPERCPRRLLPQRHLPGADPGRQGREDEQVARQRGRAVVGDQRPRRRRPALVSVHRQPAGDGRAASPPTWWARPCASSCSPSGTSRRFRSVRTGSVRARCPRWKSVRLSGRPARNRRGQAPTG